MKDTFILSYVIRMEMKEDGIGMRCYPSIEDIEPVSSASDNEYIDEIERRFPWHLSNVIGILSSAKILVHSPENVAKFLQEQAKAGNEEASRTILDMLICQTKAAMSGEKNPMGVLEADVDLENIIKTILKGDDK